MSRTPGWNSQTALGCVTAGKVDCAVHSLKDVPSRMREGVAMACVPRRGDARDLLLSKPGWALAELPAATLIGSASPRRKALLLAEFAGRAAPRVALLRGNIETRLRRVAAGDFDATFLAAAGLDRLGIGIGELRAAALEPFDFVPAPGQGALCVTTRGDDTATTALAGRLEDGASRRAVEAERAVARTLGGDCRSPVAAYASVAHDRLKVVGLAAAPDGSRMVRLEARGAAAKAERLGEELGRRLVDAGAREIIGSGGE